jgi:hypothetical protein
LRYLPVAGKRNIKINYEKNIICRTLKPGNETSNFIAGKNIYLLLTLIASRIQMIISYYFSILMLCSSEEYNSA